MWDDKFRLREHENSRLTEVQNSERRQRMTKRKFRLVESPVALIAIGIISIFILVNTPSVMQRHDINNALKLLYSGISILALGGIIAIPLGIYRFVKGKL